jgi:ankyrin repeat protein
LLLLGRKVDHFHIELNDGPGWKWGGCGQCTLLHIAVAYGHSEVVLLLLHDLADCNVTWYGKLPIHNAAMYGHSKVLRSLIQAHPEVISPKDHNNWTPLHHAAFHGWTNNVQVLLDSEADLFPKAFCGKTPGQMATQRGHPELTAMIMASSTRIHQAKCVAFAMLFHPRLGAGSQVPWLDKEVQRMILEA